MPYSHVVTRSEWGARSPRPMSMGNHPAEAFVHHSENPDAAHMTTERAQAAAVRAIQDFHMDGRGWSDIAYHFIVFPAQGTPDSKLARIFQGRDINAVPAAQLNHNTNTLAVCVYGNFDHDTVGEEIMRAIADIIKTHPTVHVVGGHRDVVATDCPGAHLYAKVPDIARLAGVRKF